MRNSQLFAHIRTHGGIVRSARLQREGWSKHALRRAVNEGALRRPGRGWICLPDADSELVHAATCGVVLSCITQAKRLGLWVPHLSEPHFATPHPHSNVALDFGRLHWGKPLIARAPGTLADSLINVLAYVAACQPYEHALAIWESALQQKLIEKESLRQLEFKGAAKQLLQESTPYSDSGLETLVRTRLRWLRVSIVPQAWLLGHRVDFLIDDWLVLQIDGAHHVGKQRTQDIIHDAELLKHGYAVVRVGYEQVVHRWPDTQRRLMDVLAIRRTR